MKRPSRMSAPCALRPNPNTPKSVRGVLSVALSLIAVASLAKLVGNAWHVPTPTLAASSQSAPRTTAQAREAYGQMPLSFEANRGQAAGSFNFLARGAGYTLALSPTEAVFALARRSDERSQNAEPLSGRSENIGAAKRAGRNNEISSASQSQPPTKILRMKLVGADQSAPVESADELQGKVNYFIGSEPRFWRTDVPTFNRVLYRNVYHGVDIVYYGNQRQLEYDFVVAPGRDPRVVRLQFDGAERADVDAAGDLLLAVGEATIRQPKPIAYQNIDGVRRMVEAGYSVDAQGEVGFEVGEYDRSMPLVIDPVLVYSTYLGGSGNDSARDIAVDSSGNAYICGETTSTNFPTANAFDATFNVGNTASDRDAFVAKLNAEGTALVYSTYLGGTGNSINLSGDDVCTGIAIDSAGNAYVAGETRSTDFPTANALQGTFGGGLFEGFLTKLNAAGSALVYSTYIGGNTFDSAASVAVDSSGSAYVAGRTTSSNFATVNPIQATFMGGGSDAFIMKFNPAGSALVYSTYLGGGGGNGFDAAFSIAIDAGGNAYITGPTLSTDFPTANAIQGTFGGGTDGDSFVAKINAGGSALVYSTYLGGSDGDTSQDITVDSSGNAHVTGSTSSTNFPIANAFDSTLSGTSDAFVTKLNASGTAFVYSTYLGGSGFEAGNDIALDSSANAQIGGGTSSTDFPMVNPTQGTYGGGSLDAFVTKLNPAGSALIFSTFLGGSGFDRANAMALDNLGSAYVAGVTDSPNFTTLSAFQTTNAGGQDAFVLKMIDPPPTPDVTIAVSPSAAAEDGATNLVYTFSRTGANSAPLTVNFSVGGTATFNTDYSQSGAATFTSSSGNVNFGAGNSTATVTIDPTADITVEPDETVILTVTSGAGYNLGSPGAATGTISNDDATPALSINDVSVAEGNSGTTNAVFVVTLSAPSSLIVTVNFATADGTATQPGDYQSTAGTLTFNPGDLFKTVSVPVNGDVTNEANETFFLNLSTAVNANISDSQGLGTILNDDTPALNYSLANYTVSESGGSALITVTRTGDPLPPVTVDYMSTDNSNPADFILCSSSPAGTASSRCDFNTALGTLRFAANEVTKTYNVLITQDSYVEGNESLQLFLSNPTGGAVLGPQSNATLQIQDDVPETSTNPILDARNFVRQQYHDFLNREPDQPGWDFWTDNITQCNDPARRPAGQTLQECLDRQRETTSGAFFLSPEFRYTGFYVYCVYKGSLGRMPTFLEFMRDVQQVSRGIIIANAVSGATIEQNRAQYEIEFIQRPEFLSIYGALNNQAYVDRLFLTTGISVTDAEKQALVDGLNAPTPTETRATVLHKVVNGTRVISEGQADIIAAYGKAFTDSQLNPAFVQMEYFGYLRRNEDAAGFNHWLNKMNSFGGDFLKAEMVRSFLMSPEYLQRFAAP